MAKYNARKRRAKKTRAHIVYKLGAVRLCVHRTPQHIYAQVIKFEQGKSSTIAAASTLDRDLKSSLTGDKKEQAKIVGNAIAKKAINAGVKKVAFDRSGFKFHGRVKALADAAREAGIDF